jgi:hypothetical protein
MALTNTQLATELYIGYFNRAPDAGGLNFWVNALNSGASLVQVANAFANSAEAQATYPFLVTPNVTDPTSFVTQVYQNVLNRAPDAPGLAFWVGQLQAGTVTPGSFIVTLEAAVNAQVGTADANTLNNKVAVGIDFAARTSAVPLTDVVPEATIVLAGVTSDPATVTAAMALTTAFIAAGGQPQTLELTTGIDALSTSALGGIFNAGPGGNAPLGTTNTLNAGDNLQDTKGDGILNYTAVANLLSNPALAAGVTINGIATANILNTAGATAGFSGNITGLTTANMLAGSNGNVQLGVASAGLNTALANIGISADSNFTAWFTPAALAGAANSVNVNLNGVNASLDLNVTSGTNGYETAVITSAVAANTLDFDVNHTSLATIKVLGDKNLTMGAGSTALDLATLATFDGTAATGNLTISFPGAGDVVVDGGHGNDSFTFPAGNAAGNITVRGNDGDDTFAFLTTNGGGVTFNAGDSADGGAGTNLLRLQVDAGAILGDGTTNGTILNIGTIQHFANGAVDGALTANMALSGSATVLDLSADYNGNDVTITNLVTAKSVLFSGDNIDDLSLDATSLLGAVNLTMAQTTTGGIQNINDLHVTVGNLLSLTSAGNATTNLITDVSDVNANVSISGAHQLSFGFTTQANAYDFAGGIIDATAQGTAGAVGLQIGLAEGKQTLALGVGNDTVQEFTSNAGEPDIINLGPLATGGNDNVIFHATFTNSNLSISNANPNYTQLQGFNVDNDVLTIDASLAPAAGQITLQETNGTSVFNPPAIFNYNIGTAGVNLTASFTDMIKVDSAVGGGQTAQTLFNNAMQATGSISVNAAANDVLMAIYNNDTQQAVMMVVHADTATANVINSGDHVDVVGQVSMTFSQFQTFGTQGSLAFV